jgi:serine/threonine protein kinase
MGVAAGTRLGQYEVRELIGKGGMGEVYRGYDTKLKRDAALKVLPEEFSRDPERLARFRREAQLLASLNHTNIATIYGIHEEPGQPVCLAMEYVPGETLADRIRKQGAVPLDEALDIAKQICDALEHAHEKPIIHRDLKPANVKLTQEGKVKVLDFGLAKAFGGDGASAGKPMPVIDSNSPTVSKFPEGYREQDFSPTIPGTILGTAAYMSPEQARGKTVDKRTDIWALGCVLYELLTGKQTFRGEDVTEILASVVKSDPDWTVLPADTPPGIRTLLRRCLQKDAAKRYRSAADIAIQIEDVGTTSSVAQTPSKAPRRWLLLGALACVVVGAIAGIAVWQLRPAPAAPPRPVERVVSALPANTTLSQTSGGVLALSPDGRRLAYVASGSGSPQQLYVRPMDGLEATPLAGTDGASGPFFSPDGEWIGFLIAGALKKISASGGAALILCNTGGAPRGAAWGPNDTIVFATNSSSGLMKVSAAGGQPQPFTSLQQGETGHYWPQFLPDGKSILFTIGTGASYDEAQIAVQRLDSSERKVLIRGGTYARYVPGYVVYYRAGTIMAVPFDPVALEVKGSASPVVGEVSGDTASGVAHFTLSNLGSLAYLRGGPQSATQTMVWVNRQGAATPLPAPPRAYRAPRLSPDGRQVAVGIGTDVWLYDIQRDTLTRLTFERNNTLTAAIWAPDGKWIVFPSDRAGPINLFWKPVDGSGPEERLTTSQNTQRAGSFPGDGRTLLYTELDPKTGQDLWVLPMEGDPRQAGAEGRKPRVFLQTPFQESSGQFSPDGRWIAYVSDESGRWEVYVRPFPGPGGKWQISTEGGTELAWNPKGRELFFRTGAQKEKMMVVEYQTQPTFSAGKPRLLLEGNYSTYTTNVTGAQYSVSPDGQRFLMTKTPDQPQASLTQINVVLNWFEELKQKMPTGK